MSEPEPEPEQVPTISTSGAAAAAAAATTPTAELATCGGGFRKTSLMLAARDNTPDVAAMALECSANQQTIDVVDEFGRTALMSAAMHGSLEVVKILCVAGADLDMRDCDGKLALELAGDEPVRLRLAEETERRATFLATLMGGARAAGAAKGASSGSAADSGDLQQMLAGLAAGGGAKTAGGATECPF